MGKISTQHLASLKRREAPLWMREEHGRVTLFSLDVMTGKAQDLRELGDDLAPSSDLGPGIRLSLAPDGRSIAYSVKAVRSSLWLLEGFRQLTLLQRLQNLATLVVDDRSAEQLSKRVVWHLNYERSDSN